MTKKWYKLACKREELQLLGTLNGGQSFRWKFTGETDKKWIGVFAEHVWILKQNDDNISYQAYGSENDESFYNKVLSDYFQLNLDLQQHYSQWSAKDSIFKEAANQFYGIRILKQDLVENIFSFICSSNNHISRISGMVEKLATLCGKEICNVDGKMYYTFPSIEALAKDNIETLLKEQGFGYRAKYINDSAKIIMKEGSNQWLTQLRNLPYEEAKNKLMTLTGIGPKVSDCICLMSLGHLQAIPVDTHVYQIAQKFYIPNLPKRKTVTTKIYNDIGNHFRNMYGPYAGWAHTVLFCADLKKFQNKDK